MLTLDAILPTRPPPTYTLSPSEQSRNYSPVLWKNLFELTAAASVTTGFILLATKLYLLLSSDLSLRLSPFAQRDWPSDPTVLAPKQFPVFLSPLTLRDLPSDPNLYKAYICRVFGIKSANVIDITGHIDRTRFIAAGGSGEVWEASWKGLDKNRIIGTPKALPMVVVKLVRLPPLRDEVRKGKRYKVSLRERQSGFHFIRLVRE
ncbi:hypothetical protein M378DRAFT_971931 [Amanita muscaria Koide BX008]|uniref:Uncharacterized protein n=1 Tax=Amanita muscaria (strain Koide BX008) TaxID=946122 RepID=A0A0C2SAC8_AMAMK|nr:hypothetical protein M378DRAFT_971931 [Amanita muscaria Koide BX008]